MRLRSVALTAALIAGLGLAARAGTGGRVEDRDKIPELKEQASAGLTKDRVEAIRKLGAISDEGRLNRFGVLDFLLGILKDDENNPLVRGAAAEALARLIRYVPTFTDKALMPLVARLQDSAKESLYVRRKIAEAMGGFLDADAVAHSMAFRAMMRIAKARSDRPALVAAVLRTLGRTGYIKALPQVVAALQHRDEQIKAAALEALKELLDRTTRATGLNDVVTQLVAFVSDEKVPVKIRIAAMEVLVRTMKSGIPIARISGPLVAVLDKTRDPDLAVAVVEVLAEVPEKSSVAALKKAYDTFLNTPNARGYLNVRTTIAYSLGEYFHPLAQKGDTPTGQEVALLLIKICQKEPPGVNKAVRAAVQSLGLMMSKKYDRRPAVKDLIQAMATDKAVAKDAYRSLNLITNTDQGEDPKKWQKWFQQKGALLGPGPP